MKKILSNKFVWALAILVLVGGYFFYRNRQPTNGQEVAIVPNRDEVVTPEMKSIQEELTLSGSIDALNKADIRFQTGGLLTWVGVKEGDRVRKWQSLASLDRRQLQKTLEQQFNNYRTQLSQFDDTQAEYKDEKDALILTDEMKRILDRSQFALNNSVVQYELADLAIKYATITTPIAGIVTTVHPSMAGTNITPATSNFVVVDPSSVYFRSEVEQDDISQLKLGQKAAIELDSYEGQTLDGTISQISFSPIEGRTTPTYNVRITFPVSNNDLKYRLGMDGDATVALSQATNTLVIPLDAIVEEDDKKYVYIKNPNSNTAQKVEVETGLETDIEVEILKGITQNDQVVIKTN